MERNYKLRIYYKSGFQKGNLKREEFFSTKESMQQRYRELFKPKEYACFRPLSGSYISQYHPRNPMSCLGRIGGLRGKSNFIEMQPFWKVKNSHKSSI